MKKINLNQENRKSVVAEIAESIRKHRCQAVYVEFEGRTFGIRVENIYGDECITARYDDFSLFGQCTGTEKRLPAINQSVDELVGFILNVQEIEECQAMCNAREQSEKESKSTESMEFAREVDEVLSPEDLKGYVMDSFEKPVTYNTGKGYCFELFKGRVKCLKGNSIVADSHPKTLKNTYLWVNDTMRAFLKYDKFIEKDIVDDETERMLEAENQIINEVTVGIMDLNRNETHIEFTFGNELADLGLCDDFGWVTESCGRELASTHIERGECLTVLTIELVEEDDTPILQQIAGELHDMYLEEDYYGQEITFYDWMFEEEYGCVHLTDIFNDKDNLAYFNTISGVPCHNVWASGAGEVTFDVDWSGIDMDGAEKEDAPVYAGTEALALAGA